MDTMSAQAWVIIITSLSTAIVAIVTAWKVNAVHTLVNSQATADKAKIDLLQNLLVAKQMELQTHEAARAMLAQGTAATLAKEEGTHIVIPEQRR